MDIFKTLLLDTPTSATLSGTVPVSQGGTGATNAADARTNLGLGTISTQDSNSVSITGGTITGITDLAVADGGTGLSTIPTNGQLPIGNGTGYSVAAITAGTGITVTNGSGSITLSTTTDQTAAKIVATVTNAESVAITKGQVVYAFSATGNRMSVKLADNTSDLTSAKTFGVVSDTSISAGGTGVITIFGVVDGLNLGTFTDGDTVYLGATAGAITATKPYAPNHLVYVGIIERANNGNGQLFVRTQNGYELDEIHDVQITGTPAAGSFIIRDATTSLWKNATLTAGTNIAVTNADASVTVGITGTIASSNGGTGNGFTKFSGPTTSEKTFTLPNSSETLLYSGGPLGTPSSATLTNATSLPVSTGISGLGTNVATALAVNTGTAGAFVVNGGALGTPSSGTLSSCSGLPVSTGVSGLGTGVATALAVNTGSAGAVVLLDGALGTPSSGTVTNLTGTASININGTVGATTPTTGKFTTLDASSTVSGTGFSTYLASPPAIGGTAPAAGKFTTLDATGNVGFDGGTFTFNEAGADKDFRIEGDSKTHLFFSDASVDRIGINQSAPAARLDLDGNYASNITAVSALDIDCATANYFTKTIAADSTFTFSNSPSSRAYAFALELTHTSGAITWPAAVKWPKNIAPTLTTGKTHIFIFVTDDSGTTWRGASLVDYVN